MPARTGAEFRDALNGSRRDVQVHGERVRERVGEHPALRGLVDSYAVPFRPATRAGAAGRAHVRVTRHGRSRLDVVPRAEDAG